MKTLFITFILCICFGSYAQQVNTAYIIFQDSDKAIYGIDHLYSTNYDTNEYRCETHAFLSTDDRVGFYHTFVYDNPINKPDNPILIKPASFLETIEHIDWNVYTKDFSNIREKDFDVLIVGSDQIWRPKYFYSRIEDAYLDFAKEWKIKRITYAASFGTEEWEYTEEQTNNCATLLKKFNAVSVRESSAVKLCYDNFGVKAEHVLDPTMLLSKEDYIKLFKDYNAAQSDGNLFCYILDDGEEKKSIIDCVAKEKGLKAFYVNSRYEDLDASLEERIQQPVEKWLRAFYDAEFIITDSFHACVFSIIFNKPFIVYGNKERGLARFNSLLSIFGLEERIVSTKEEATKAISKPINWEKVNESHRQWKEKSMSFLNNNLK